MNSIKPKKEPSQVVPRVNDPCKHTHTHLVQFNYLAQAKGLKVTTSLNKKRVLQNGKKSNYKHPVVSLSQQIICLFK